MQSPKLHPMLEVALMVSCWVWTILAFAIAMEIIKQMPQGPARTRLGGLLILATVIALERIWRKFDNAKY
jgi:hypothetical protein